MPPTKSLTPEESAALITLVREMASGVNEIFNAVEADFERNPSTDRRRDIIKFGIYAFRQGTKGLEEDLKEMESDMGQGVIN
jgi:hypothetical protein